LSIFDLFGRVAAMTRGDRAPMRALLIFLRHPGLVSMPEEADDRKGSLGVSTAMRRTIDYSN
jgi:hypothetical protein